MRRFIIGIALAALLIAAAAWGQQTLYSESFANGQMNLTWHVGWGDSAGVGNNMQAYADPTTPEGDGWAGKVGNNLSGGGVGLTYAGDSLLANYTLSAWVYATVTSNPTGPYNSLTFRLHPATAASTPKYYQFDTDFDINNRLRFRKFGDGSGYPTTILDWSATLIPGGAPTTSGWHLMRVRMHGNQFWLWWDGHLLPGCPVTDTLLTTGYFGSYIFDMMSSTAVTKSDNYLVKDNVVGVYLNPSGTYPIVLPPIGGILTYEAQVINYTATTQARIAWVKVRNPNGTWTLPILGPLALSIPGNANLSRMRSLTIPGTWPSGTYLVRGYLAAEGMTPVDSSSFVFSKGADGDAITWTGGNVMINELFPGEQSQTAFIPSGLDLVVSPNPFNPVTAISYQLQATSQVSLRIYDTAGRLVATLVDGVQEAGTHQVTFDGSELPSGMYLARLEAGEFTAVQKLVLMK